MSWRARKYAYQCPSKQAHAGRTLKIGTLRGILRDIDLGCGSSKTGRHIPVRTTGPPLGWPRSGRKCMIMRLLADRKNGGIPASDYFPSLKCGPLPPVAARGDSFLFENKELANVPHGEHRDFTRSPRISASTGPKRRRSPRKRFAWAGRISAYLVSPCLFMSTPASNRSTRRRASPIFCPRRRVREAKRGRWIPGRVGWIR